MLKFMKLEVFQGISRIKKKINKPSEGLDIYVSISQLPPEGNSPSSVRSQQNTGALSVSVPSQNDPVFTTGSYRPCNQNIIIARAFHIFFVSKLSNIPFLNSSRG